MKNHCLCRQRWLKPATHGRCLPEATVSTMYIFYFAKKQQSPMLTLLWTHTHTLFFRQQSERLRDVERTFYKQGTSWRTTPCRNWKIPCAIRGTWRRRYSDEHEVRYAIHYCKTSCKFLKNIISCQLLWCNTCLMRFSDLFRTPWMTMKAVMFLKRLCYAFT